MKVSISGARISGIVLAAAAALGIAGTCGGSAAASTSANTTIVYMGGNWEAPTIKQLIVPFEKSHPGITVKFVPASLTGLSTQLDATVGQGQSTPDVFMADQPNTPTFASRHLVMDLSSQVPALKKIAYADSIQQSSYEGQLYSLPLTQSTNMIFYNKALLAKAGVTPPSSSPGGRWTWQQLVAAAKKVQAAGAKYGILFDQFDAYYQLAPLAESLGGGTGLTGHDSLTPQVTNAAWVKAMTWYRSLFSSGVSPRGVTGDETYDLFGAGKAAFLLGGPWTPTSLLSYTKTIKMGYAPEPYMAGGKPVTPTGGWSIAVNPLTQHKAAALAFAEWVSENPAGNIAWNVVDGDLSAQPTNQAQLVKQSVYSWWPGSASLPKLMTYELNHTGVGRPRSIGYVQFENIMDSTFASIRDGANPAKALASATSQIKSAFSDLP